MPVTSQPRPHPPGRARASGELSVMGGSRLGTAGLQGQGNGLVFDVNVKSVR